MANQDDGEELLRRTRQLRERAGGGPPADGGKPGGQAGDHGKPARPSIDQTMEDLGWLARKLRRMQQISGEIRQVLGKLAPLFRPVGWVLGPLWRALKWTLVYAACRPDATGARTLEGFSPRRLVASTGVALAFLVVSSAAYVYGTRERGRFIISNYHLIDAQSDTYQMGGCPKVKTNQTECEPGHSEIMLVAPDWLSTVAHFFGASEGVLGIDALGFAEIAGGIPQQGECVISRYGVYFRPPPVLRFLRGTTKRHVVHVGTCEVYGIRKERRERDPEP